MRCHQILTGACNAGEKCFAVGSVEGVSFTAYAAGCNIVILASNFERVQVIPGACHDNVQILCIDCSTDTGKIAAGYGKLVCIFEPTPLFLQNSSNDLNYRWIQTGIVEAGGFINVLAFNTEGTRLLTAGDSLQLWASPVPSSSNASSRPMFDLEEEGPEELSWQCIWSCQTAYPTTLLAFSPDGSLFATCSPNDRLVKVWYDNKMILSPSKAQETMAQGMAESSRLHTSYGYIYLPHPSAVTGFTWRATSKYMPKGSVGNVLVTCCRDAVCRIWAETVLPDDGLVSFHHLDPIAAQNPRFRMHRHKHRFVQRLRHIKTCFQLRRQSRSGGISSKKLEPIPTLPSSYSVHDFHLYGMHAAGITPGFHFSLAASINADTDMFLVPSLNTSTECEQNFVVHWLNNKEMHFTSEAEKIILEMTKLALEKEVSSVIDPENVYSETAEEAKPKIISHRPVKISQHKGRSFDDDEFFSGKPLSAATSSTSIATDATTPPLGDMLDKKIETLIRDWYHSSDILFAIHPVDGSLLVWTVEFLDGYPGSFRQAQVSFSARIPNALPLGDAMNMSANLAIYNGMNNFIKNLIKMESISTDEEKKIKNRAIDSIDAAFDKPVASPVICLTTKHSNGSLNLWHLTVASESKFAQILNISHWKRMCGHRFQLNDLKCHPVLPLLLTTSHHNQQKTVTPPPGAADDTPLICIQDPSQKNWCSELILWKVEAVGPLSMSGGVTELSRINSPSVSAFSNVAWIPTLLPSTTLGSVSNSPSACFVASDGECLRVYQAVIDARALLSEISTAERKKTQLMESTMSLSTDSSLQENIGHTAISDMFNIVSEQSTVRPGCIIQLDTIIDATHDWQNTQFLHVFQEGLIRGGRGEIESLFSTEHSAVIDLNSKTAFEENFYITLLEKTVEGPIMHMWRLVISSQYKNENENVSKSMANGTSVQNAEASPIFIQTSKMYCKRLPLPAGVDVVHSYPAAGHLSSASIYPACYAPYVLVTACSDNVLRFWRCKVTGAGDDIKTEWIEWSMISKNRDSSIQIPGRLLQVNSAYSGRIAVAYEREDRKCVSSSPNGALIFNCIVDVYECESTGGSEWILVDAIKLNDVTSANSIDIDDLDTRSPNSRAVGRLSTIFHNEETINSSERYSITSINNQMQVPSVSTLQSLKFNKFDKQGIKVKQKHPIQLDWLSMENGSHLLTVAIGSKIYVYTSVSEEIQKSNVNLHVAVLAEGRKKPMLQKSHSLHQISQEVLPKWMMLEKLQLLTADGLTPLPMQISWVRDGILVVGMDNEIHVYSQWPSTPCTKNAAVAEVQVIPEEAVTNRRDLSRSHFKSYFKDSTSKTSASLSRITSYSVLLSLDSKMKKGLADIIETPYEEDDEIDLTGMFEVSQLAAPILPQYHPTQLNELLNFGKVKRVKAILAHLLKYLLRLGKKSDMDYRASGSETDDGRRSWHRSRTLSIPGSGSLGREGRNSLSLRPEELTLDYMEVKTIPPVPLWLLVQADTESQTTKAHETTQDTYVELFSGPARTEDELSLDDDEPDLGSRRKSLTLESKGLAFFGPRQAQCLASLLTHAQLPGLSSSDQMHLLALADTVASCNVDFADRFDINKAKEAMAKETYSRSATDEPSMESLDDCGLRFLLAMRHHTYLLRCLPFGQRAQFQKAGIGSHNLVWAFHSESQEELLDFIPAVRQGNIKWSELRELGIGWWVRSNTVLSRIIHKVAKAAFLLKNDPLDAAIYYLAMKKRSLVWGLFRSINDRQKTEFFSNNFAEDRWRKAALKNAFALMGKQRFEHAAAFFLLAGALNDAIEVVLNKLEDEQLAFVIIRLYEGELISTPPTLTNLFYTKFLGSDQNGHNQDLNKAHPDPFIRSVVYWTLKDYNSSLNTLLLSDPTVGSEHPAFSVEASEKNKELRTAHPSVFNFYIYLRTHPLLIRQCIANTAKDSTGGFMAARLGSGHDALDKKSAYESTMTPQERCLYFTTASAHLCSGCPTLALEVMSKLPINVIDLDHPESGDLLGSPTKSRKPGHDLIKSGTLEEDGSFETPQQIAAETAADLFKPKTNTVDNLFKPSQDLWSTPVPSAQVDELQLDFNMDNDNECVDSEPEEEETKKGNPPSESDTCKNLDIMAQQLKFISCLKMMMEELATLATGCEVDGGQLRYELYIWLEKEVEALKKICNYRNTVSSEGHLLSPDEREYNASPFADQPASLHEILQQEKEEFEDKVERSSRRKRWLVANQQLLRTLLSYCSLHGSSGGGLASVRMELILLLQELQQDNNKQQLLSPLPFPTTLPLLSASIAANKTVVSDPIRHLQLGAQDLLQSLVEVNEISYPNRNLWNQSQVLRNLAAALSACIYQSLCDSDNIGYNKYQTKISDNQIISKGINSPLQNRDHKFSETEETSKVCSPPNKWPGVPSLLALIAREKDEDTPKLNILLCEAFVSIYLSFLIYGLACCDAYILYRLVSINCTEKDWASMFGGCVRKTLKVITNSLPPEKDVSPAVSGERILSTISSLQKTRIKLNMKLLGQLGFQEKPQEEKPSYREQFMPPEMSIVSYLLKKPPPTTETENIDYDSSASDEEDEDLDYDADEDVFREPKTELENSEHSDSDSYSWCLLRLASMKKAQSIVQLFLKTAEVDFQELAVQSPLLHAVLYALHGWVTILTDHIEDKKGPSPEYIPGCFVETSVNGPSMLKYKALLEPYNTPFAKGKRGVKPISRLWMTLVRSESVQEVFVRYIFGRKRPIEIPTAASEQGDEKSESPEGTEAAVSECAETHPEPSEQGAHSDTSIILEPVRIIHKDQDSVAAFCINKNKANVMAIATPKEVQELDISLLLNHPNWLTSECELDVLTLNKDPDNLPSPGFLVIQTPYDKALLEARGMDNSFSTMNMSNSPLTMQQTGRGTSVVMTYKHEGVRRMTSHPTLPLYLIGNQDGSVVVREWHHNQVVSRPRPGGTFAKVTKVRFNEQGNKFGVIDGDGHLSLYHLGLCGQDNNPFSTMQCHNKHGNDFTFVGSSSLIATAGQSSENRNISLWDTLLPPRKANIVSWTCHESGASAIVYAPQHQVLISAGKKGQVFIFDVRQRAIRQRFPAHEAAIKSMTIDMNEDYFVTGSADGDIKVWGLSVHNLVYNLPGEHSRTSLFKNLSQGVTQLYLDANGRLFSCGADGSVKLRQLPERDLNVNLF